MTTQTYAPAPVRPPLGALSIITLATAVFTGYGAIILGVIALRQNWVKGTRGSGLAWAGIVLGTLVGTAWSLVLMVLLM